jgi:ABC-type uncharacterized transport system involved in gliding motility auxiliary subunit
MARFSLDDRRAVAAVCIALAIVFFLALNIWADRSLQSTRLDATADGIYSITNGTRKMLAGIDEPVTLRLYRSAGLEALGPVYTKHAKRISEMLDEYARLSGGKVRVEIYDPKPYSREEDLAVADGIQGIPNSADGTQIFFGLAGTNSIDGRYVLPHMAPERGKFLEYDLTRLIGDLANPKKTVVAVIGDLPLRGDRMSQSRPWAVMDQIERFFAVKTMFGSIDKIDDDVDVLVLAQPGALDEVTQYAVDQFVMRGGRVLAFLDPHPEALAMPAIMQRQPPPPNPLTTQTKLLEAWGLDINRDKFVGDRGNGLRVQAQVGNRPVITQYVAWMQLGRDRMDENDPITGNLRVLQFRTPGAIKLREGSGMTLEPLVTSSADSMLVDVTRVMMMPDPVQLQAEFKAEGSFVLAGRVSGPVKTAFPDGPPEAVKNEDVRKAHLNEAKTPLNMVVIADTDMLEDGSWQQEQNLLGQRIVVPFANNADMAVNVLDSLSGSDAMLGLRGRGVQDRRFAVLDDIARQAEIRYRATEQELKKRIEDMQKKIEELQGKGAEGSLVVTSADEQEIEKMRSDMLDLREQLRDVQFRLRKDVADLKTVVTAINIWAVPLLVGLLALGFAVWRGVRARRRHQAA